MLLTSISATERVKLWDRFTGPVDQDTIKLEFFRRVSRRNPPFRFKVALPRRNRALVPEMVRYHYQKPAKLLPSLRDVFRLESVCGGSIKSENVDEEEDSEVSGRPECNGEAEEVANGAVKTEGEVFNGVDGVKKEVFLPDVVSDVSGEGEFLVVVFLLYIEQSVVVFK